MSRTAVRSRRAFRALTISRRGRLSKDHLSDPSKGLPMELRKEQAEAIEVSLRPLRPVETPESE